MLAVADSRPPSPAGGSIPGRSARCGDRVPGDLEEVEHLADAEAVPAARHLDHHDGALVVRPARLLEEDVAIEHGEQGRRGR